MKLNNLTTGYDQLLPCGEGLGVGVAVGGRVSRNNNDPPPQPSPTRGEGAHRLRGYKFVEPLGATPPSPCHPCEMTGNLGFGAERNRPGRTYVGYTTQKNPHQ